MGAGGVKRLKLDPETGDLLFDADGDAIEEDAPEPAKPSEPVGVKGGLFPRTEKAAEAGRSYPAQVGSAGLDIASLPGRFAGSLNAPDGGSIMEPAGPGGSMIPVQAGAVKGRKGAESGLTAAMADTQGKSFGQRILRDPGTAAALVAAPFTGGVSLAGVGGAALRGGLVGAASAATHQAENALDGRGVNPLQAGTEVALNAAIPAGGAWAAPYVKLAGAKIFNSVVKPSKQAIRAGYNTEKFLDTGLGGSLKSSHQSVEDKIDDLAAQIEDIITQKSRPATVTSKGAAPGPNPAPRSGVDASGRVVDEAEDVIYQGAAANPAVSGLRGLPESTVPGPDDVIQSGMNRPAQLPPPPPIITPAPRPRLETPDVAVPPNRAPMPNQIDPRFIRPTATSTPNQPPIPSAPLNEAYGVPSSRNLPATVGNRGMQATEGQAVSPEEQIAAILGRPPAPTKLAGLKPNLGPATLRGASGEAAEAPFRGGQAALPPGASEQVTDITKRVDLLDALNSTKRGMRQELASGAHAGLADDIGSGQAQWLADLEARGMAGAVPPVNALTYQRGVGAMGKFDYGQNPQLVPPKARVANKLYGQIGDRLEEVAPEIGPLRKEISDLIPARMALTGALERTDKNFALSLKEAIAAAGAMQGAAAAGPIGALPGLGLAGSIHASQSPRIGNFLYQQGKSMAEPSALRDAIKRYLLQAVFAQDVSEESQRP
jgi:hypothetical protein